MNITEHRKNYFHIDGIRSTQKDVIEGQETVEEWKARTNKEPDVIPLGVGRFLSDLEKANKQKENKSYGRGSKTLKSWCLK